MQFSNSHQILFPTLREVSKKMAKKGDNVSCFKWWQENFSYFKRIHHRFVPDCDFCCFHWFLWDALAPEVFQYLPHPSHRLSKIRIASNTRFSNIHINTRISNTKSSNTNTNTSSANINTNIGSSNITQIQHFPILHHKSEFRFNGNR